MYRKKRGPMSLLIIGGLIFAVVAIVWYVLPSGQKDKLTQPGAATAKPTPAPAPPSIEPVRETVQKPPAPAPETIVAKPPPAPLVEINQGSKIAHKPETSGGQGSANPAPHMESTPAAPPPSAPVVVPTASPSAIDQVPSVSAARQKQQEGDLVTARILFSRVLADGKLMPSEEQAVREELSKINDDLVFSPKVTATDPFVETYKVQSGDSLDGIRKRMKLSTEWRLIQRVNRISNPNNLRLGQTLKILRAQFHVVVHKSQYRLDLFMGPPDDESKWLFVRSFTVGLGEGNSTPVGTFVVRPASKLVNPYWVNPRTGERFGADDPKNPIGEYWVGLEGVGESIAQSGYGIHGTIDPESIGKQKSMGCVRLGAEDIALLYEMLGEGSSMVKIEP